MAVNRLLLLGGGAHASDLLGVIEACNRAGGDYVVAGIVDRDAESPRFADRDVRIYRIDEGDIAAADIGPADFLSAVGYPRARLRVADRAAALGLDAAAPIIHPGAVYIGTHVTLGRGTVVHAGVSISVAAAVGEHCYLSHGALIGHDSRIGRGASVMPGASLSGGVTLGEGVMVGSGAVILEGLTIGEWASIGANAVVTKDVREGLTVVGVPARPAS